MSLWNIWCVNVGLSIVTNIPLWWEILRRGRLCLGRGIWEIYVLSSQFCCVLKTALKKNSLKNDSGQGNKRCKWNMTNIKNCNQIAIFYYNTMKSNKTIPKNTVKRISWFHCTSQKLKWKENQLNIIRIYIKFVLNMSQNISTELPGTFLFQGGIYDS